MGDYNYDTYCGLYCGACSIIKAYQTGIKDPLACCLGDELGMELKCHGCKTDSVFGNCAVCQIRNCARGKGVERCLNCSDFPCPNFTSMEFLLEMLPHWNTAVTNQEYIGNHGAARWLEQQATQWKCPDCHTDYSWYATHCANCGKERSTLRPYRNSFDKRIFQLMAMPSPDEMFKKEVVFKLSGMDQVKVQKEISYNHGEGKFLLDLYFPPGAVRGQKLPLVVLVHGEAEARNMKDSGPYTSMGRVIAASGLAAATFNHRTLLQGFQIKDVIADIENLIAFLINNADAYGIDKNRIAVWALSSGVPYGLYAGIHNHPAYIKCIVAYYGFGEFASLCGLLNIPFNAGGWASIQAEQYSPLQFLSQNPDRIAPMFITRAGRDQIPHLLESLDGFISTALANNIHIDLYNHPNGVHAFDLFNDEPRTHEIIEKTLEFLKRHLLIL